MRNWIRLAVAAAALAVAAGSAGAQEKLKVGFIYVGPRNDGGWSQRHEIGRQAVEEAFPGQVETTYVENVSEGPDAERVIEQLARAGNKLIFTTSFGFMNPTLKVAQRFKDVKFEHATGFKQAANVATYNARFYEGRYILGQIAAKMSKSGTAGYIASFPIPEVVMGINAFVIGARTINPDFTVKVVWANTWHDPGKEADAAKVLLDQGVDILAQHTDSPAALQIAQERGAYAFGQASDMIEFAPKAQLTAIVDNWNPYYVERVKAMLDGAWESHDVWYGIPEGMVEMAPYTNMPDDVKQMAEETEEKIRLGELHPFTGPIRKQDGSEAVAEGQTMPDSELLGMNYYVEGVEGDLPK
ncbi:BMP family ABC transporter substrate-binding protein [Faunimonas sp. B44]|uniref:BMP family ABC transporter substrate-binding protein n=1 Tax=Faunimonas sp. B44 TaxID=3461493 RepID=UPI004043D025